MLVPLRPRALWLSSPHMRRTRSNLEVENQSPIRRSLLQKVRSHMYYRVVSQFARTLKNVDGWLDKAERHAAVK